jgi:hypothetical protein
MVLTGFCLSFCGRYDKITEGLKKIDIANVLESGLMADVCIHEGAGEVMSLMMKRERRKLGEKQRLQSINIAIPGLWDASGKAGEF